MGLVQVPLAYAFLIITGVWRIFIIAVIVGTGRDSFGPVIIASIRFGRSNVTANNVTQYDLTTVGGPIDG